MKRYLLAVFGFFTITFATIAQEEKFGKVSDSHWKLDHCSFDTISPAVVLFDVGNIIIEGVEVPPESDPECRLRGDLYTLLFERHVRIKILKNSGVDNDVLTVQLRSADHKKDRLVSFQGLSIRIENGREVKTSFNSRDLVEEDSGQGDCIRTFKLPQVADGTILDLMYRIQSPIIDETPGWVFSNKYPTLYSEVRISLPDFFRYKIQCPVLNNLDHDFHSRSIRYSVSYPITNGWKTSYYEYNQNFEEYSLKNIPVTGGEPLAPGLKYIITAMDFITVKVTSGVWRRQN